MGLFLLKKDGEYLGKVYEPGYHYSEYTHEDARYGDCWKPLKEYLGEDRDSGITIFVSKDAAKKHADTQYSWSRSKIEIVPLAALYGEIEE